MWRPCALLLLVVGAWPALARAEHPSVARAHRAYTELRFEVVLAEIADARRKGGLSPSDELELTRLEAFTYAVYDDRPRAVDAFQRLIGLSPTWTPPSDTSPKIRRYFDEARRAGGRLPPGAATPAGGAPHDVTPPFYRSPWFWGSVAVALVAGVGAGILASSDDPARPRGNLGTLELP